MIEFPWHSPTLGALLRDGLFKKSKGSIGYLKLKTNEKETTSCYKCQEIDIKLTRNAKEWEIKLNSGKIIWDFMLGQNLG